MNAIEESNLSSSEKWKSSSNSSIFTPNALNPSSLEEIRACLDSTELLERSERSDRRTKPRSSPSRRSGTGVVVGSGSPQHQQYQQKHWQNRNQRSDERSVASISRTTMVSTASGASRASASALSASVTSRMSGSGASAASGVDEKIKRAVKATIGDSDNGKHFNPRASRMRNSSYSTANNSLASGSVTFSYKDLYGSSSDDESFPLGYNYWNNRLINAASTDGTAGVGAVVEEDVNGSNSEGAGGGSERQRKVKKDSHLKSYNSRSSLSGSEGRRSKRSSMCSGSGGSFVSVDVHGWHLQKDSTSEHSQSISSCDKHLLDLIPKGPQQKASSEGGVVGCGDVESQNGNADSNDQQTTLLSTAVESLRQISIFNLGGGIGEARGRTQSTSTDKYSHREVGSRNLSMSNTSSSSLDDDRPQLRSFQSNRARSKTSRNTSSDDSDSSKSGPMPTKSFQSNRTESWKERRRKNRQSQLASRKKKSITCSRQLLEHSADDESVSMNSTSLASLASISSYLFGNDNGRGKVECQRTNRQRMKQGSEQPERNSKQRNQQNSYKCGSNDDGNDVNESSLRHETTFEQSHSIEGMAKEIQKGDHFHPPATKKEIHHQSRPIDSRQNFSPIEKQQCLENRHGIGDTGQVVGDHQTDQIKPLFEERPGQSVCETNISMPCHSIGAIFDANEGQQCLETLTAMGQKMLLVSPQNLNGSKTQQIFSESGRKFADGYHEDAHLFELDKIEKNHQPELDQIVTDQQSQFKPIEKYGTSQQNQTERDHQSQQGNYPFKSLGHEVSGPRNSEVRQSNEELHKKQQLVSLEMQQPHLEVSAGNYQTENCHFLSQGHSLEKGAEPEKSGAKISRATASNNYYFIEVGRDPGLGNEANPKTEVSVHSSKSNESPTSAKPINFHIDQNAAPSLQMQFPTFQSSNSNPDSESFQDVHEKETLPEEPLSADLFSWEQQHDSIKPSSPIHSSNSTFQAQQQGRSSLQYCSNSGNNSEDENCRLVENHAPSIHTESDVPIVTKDNMSDFFSEYEEKFPLQPHSSHQVRQYQVPSPVVATKDTRIHPKGDMHEISNLGVITSHRNSSNSETSPTQSLHSNQSHSSQSNENENASRNDDSVNNPMKDLPLEDPLAFLGTQSKQLTSSTTSESVESRNSSEGQHSDVQSKASRTQILNLEITTNDQNIPRSDSSPHLHKLENQLTNVGSNSAKTREIMSNQETSTFSESGPIKPKIETQDNGSGAINQIEQTAGIQGIKCDNVQDRVSVFPAEKSQTDGSMGSEPNNPNCDAKSNEKNVGTMDHHQKLAGVLSPQLGTTEKSDRQKLVTANPGTTSAFISRYTNKNSELLFSHNANEHQIQVQSGTAAAFEEVSSGAISESKSKMDQIEVTAKIFDTGVVPGLKCEYFDHHPLEKDFLGKNKINWAKETAPSIVKEDLPPHTICEEEKKTCLSKELDTKEHFEPENFNEDIDCTVQFRPSLLNAFNSAVDRASFRRRVNLDEDSKVSSSSDAVDWPSRVSSLESLNGLSAARSGDDCHGMKEARNRTPLSTMSSLEEKRLISHELTKDNKNCSFLIGITRQPLHDIYESNETSQLSSRHQSFSTSGRSKSCEDIPNSQEMSVADHLGECLHTKRVNTNSINAEVQNVSLIIGCGKRDILQANNPVQSENKVSRKEGDSEGQTENLRLSPPTNILLESDNALKSEMGQSGSEGSNKNRLATVDNDSVSSDEFCSSVVWPQIGDYKDDPNMSLVKANVEAGGHHSPPTNTTNSFIPVKSDVEQSGTKASIKNRPAAHNDDSISSDGNGGSVVWPQMEDYEDLGEVMAQNVCGEAPLKQKSKVEAGGRFSPPTNSISTIPAKFNAERSGTKSLNKNRHAAQEDDSESSDGNGGSVVWPQIEDCKDESSVSLDEVMGQNVYGEVPLNPKSSVEAGGHQSPLTNAAKTASHVKFDAERSGNKSLNKNRHAAQEDDSISSDCNGESVVWPQIEDYDDDSKVSLDEVMSQNIDSEAPPKQKSSVEAVAHLSPPTNTANITPPVKFDEEQSEIKSLVKHGYAADENDTNSSDDNDGSVVWPQLEDYDDDPSVSLGEVVGQALPNPKSAEEADRSDGGIRTSNENGLVSHDVDPVNSDSSDGNGASVVWPKLDISSSSMKVDINLGNDSLRKKRLLNSSINLKSLQDSIVRRRNSVVKVPKQLTASTASIEVDTNISVEVDANISYSLPNIDLKQSESNNDFIFASNKGSLQNALDVGPDEQAFQQVQDNRVGEMEYQQHDIPQFCRGSLINSDSSLSSLDSLASPVDRAQVICQKFSPKNKEPRKLNVTQSSQPVPDMGSHELQNSGSTLSSLDSLASPSQGFVKSIQQTTKVANTESSKRTQETVTENRCSLIHEVHDVPSKDRGESLQDERKLLHENELNGLSRQSSFSGHRRGSKASFKIDESEVFQSSGFDEVSPFDRSSTTLNSDGIDQIDPNATSSGQDDFDFAMNAYTDAIKYGHLDHYQIGMDENDHSLAAKAYMGLGFSRQCKGELESSLDAYKKSLQLWQEELGRDDPNNACLEYTVGAIFNEMQQQYEASTHFNNALRLFKRKKTIGESHGITHNPTVKASILCTEGMMFSVVGEVNRALDCFRQALLIYQNSNSPLNLKFASVMFEMGSLFAQINEWEDSANCYKFALEIRKSRLGDSFIVARTHYSLGVTLASQENNNSASASSHLEEALRISQLEFGAENLQAVIIIHAMGVLHERNGDFLSASGWFTKERNMRKQLLGEDHPSVASVSSDLGTCYYNSGKYELATSLFQDALRITLLDESSESLQVADALYKIASCHDSLCEYEDALEKFNEAKRIRESHFGLESSPVVQTMLRIGNVQLGMGETRSALDCFNEVLGIGYASDSVNGIEVANALYGRGCAQFCMFMLSDAMKSFSESLNWKLAALGEDDPGLACIFYQMAHVYLEQSESEEAITCFEEYARLQRLEEQRNLHDNAEICFTEGIVAKLKGRTEAAISYYNQALAMFETLFGSDHEKVASIHFDIGCVHVSLNDDENALNQFRSCLVKRRKLLGSHVDVANVLYEMASIYQRGNNVNLATACLEECVDIWKQKLEGSEKMASVCQLSGKLWKSLRRYREAEENLERALELSITIHGQNHESVAAILLDLGELLQEISQIEQALFCFDESIQIFQDIFGPDDPNVAQVLYSKGVALLFKGDYEEASICLNRSLSIRKEKLGCVDCAVGDTLNTIGFLNLRIGNIDGDEALGPLMEALEIRRAVGNKSKVVSTLQNIGSVYKKRKEYDSCMEVYSDLLAVRQEEFGTNDERVADAWINLGNVQTSAGRIVEATVSYEEALRIRTLINGYNHKSVAQVLFKIGSLNSRRNEFSDAKQLFEEYIRIRAEEEDDPDEEMAQAQTLLGDLQKETGEKSKAQINWMSALDIYLQLGYPEDHPKVTKLRARQSLVPVGLFGQRRKSRQSFVDLAGFLAGTG